MNIGDLVSIMSTHPNLVQSSGIGVYLGLGKRGTANTKKYEAFLWRGRVATFDRPHWIFKVFQEELILEET